MANADFTPSLDGYTGQGAFRFWCQKVLPLVYDDSLSYYELLCKVVDYLNKVIQDVSATETNVDRLLEAYNLLQGYVNTYFNNLDVQDEIDNKLDEMLHDGSLQEAIQPAVNAAVSQQIGSAVNAKLDDEVALQLPGVVSEQIDEAVAAPTIEATENWLDENITVPGESFVLDASLTLPNAAAQAKATGDAIAGVYKSISNVLTAEVTSAGNRNYAYSLKNGTQYRVANTSPSGSALMNLFDADSMEDTDTSNNTRYANSLERGGVTVFTASADAEYIRVYFNAAGSFEIVQLDTVDNLIDRNAEQIEAMQGKKTASGTATAAGRFGIIGFPIIAGKRYLITNTGTASATFSTGNSIPGAAIETVGTIAPGASMAFTPQTSAAVMRGNNNSAPVSFTIHEYSDLEIESQILLANMKDMVKPLMNEFSDSRSAAGGLGYNFAVTAGTSYRITNTGSAAINVYTRTSPTSTTNIQTMVLGLEPGKCVIVKATSNANAVYVYYGGASGILFEEMARVATLEELVNSLIPMADFKYDTELKDVSAENAQMLWTGNNLYTVMQQVYALFDALTTANPGYITRVDAAVEMDLTYPAYANGIDADHLIDEDLGITRKVTPAYKTYMYKLIDSNTYAGNAGTCKKKKIFIFAGEHGNEYAAPFNTYLLANELCKCTDPDIFSLRAGYDIYILPCLDGYGMCHRERGNGNHVNINRNYPITGWAEYGTRPAVIDTDDYLNQYTGPSAGSEFETQLIIALVNSIKPDIIIDHHNYGGERGWQFYAETVNRRHANPLYLSLTDCSRTFKTAYSSDFGSGYGLLVNESGGAPGTIGAPNGTGAGAGTSDRYFYQQGHEAALIEEVSNCINYTAGTAVPGHGHDAYSNKAFSIGLYTLENVIKHICDDNNVIS